MNDESLLKEWYGVLRKKCIRRIQMEVWRNIGNAGLPQGERDRAVARAGRMCQQRRCETHVETLTNMREAADAFRSASGVLSLSTTENLEKLEEDLAQAKAELDQEDHTEEDGVEVDQELEGGNYGGTKESCGIDPVDYEKGDQSLPL